MKQSSLFCLLVLTLVTGLAQAEEVRFPIDPIPPPPPHLTTIESLNQTALPTGEVRVDVTYTVPCPFVSFNRLTRSQLSEDGVTPEALAIGVYVTPGACEGPKRSESKSFVLPKGHYRLVKQEAKLKYEALFFGNAETAVKSVDFSIHVGNESFLRARIDCETTHYPHSHVTECKDARHEIQLAVADELQSRPRALYSSIIEDGSQVESNGYCEESPGKIDCTSREFR